MLYYILVVLVITSRLSQQFSNPNRAESYFCRELTQSTPGLEEVSSPDCYIHGTNKTTHRQSTVACTPLMTSIPDDQGQFEDTAVQVLVSSISESPESHSPIPDDQFRSQLSYSPVTVSNVEAPGSYSPIPVHTVDALESSKDPYASD